MKRSTFELGLKLCIYDNNVEKNLFSKSTCIQRFVFFFSFSYQSGIFLSTIATLSTVMGVQVRLTNVSVPDGGLQSHDMRVLQLLRMICNGTLAANTGLSTVTYVPGELLSGHLSAEAGRLGYVAISIYKFSCLIPYISLTEVAERICLMITTFFLE